jgi:hypothetical protein
MACLAPLRVARGAINCGGAFELAVSPWTKPTPADRGGFRVARSDASREGPAQR